MLLTITQLGFWTIFCLFLSIATITDFQRFIIPNWVVSSIFILFTLYASVMSWLDPFSTFPNVLSAIVAAVPVFAISATLNHFRLLGGGDAKLITVVTLWAGQEFVFDFIIVTLLAGGGLAVCYMAFYALKGQKTALSTAGATAGNTQSAQTQNVRQIPYAAAICAGGVFLTCQFLEKFIL